jgi:hypothetical protein
MKITYQTNKPSQDKLGDILKKRIADGSPSAIAVASAFVSVEGFQHLSKVSLRAGIRDRFLLAGLSHYITHPNALVEAKNSGWKVRVSGQTGPGIFHPKIILTGRGISHGSLITERQFSYMGSSNLTYAGLFQNTECGIISTKHDVSVGLEECYSELWNSSEEATTDLIAEYADKFAIRNKKRSLDELDALGVSGRNMTKSSLADLRKNKNNPIPALPLHSATAAWAGLESFTGEYRFQVEFPKAAGMTLNKIIKTTATGDVDLLCEDGQVRLMTYGYYPDNGMFRLNIPNDVPNVTQARENKSGIVLIELEQNQNDRATLKVIPNGALANSVVTRSALLGTLGRTTTRLYGWY